ncbi:MAG: HpcH/HpaI aldolase/citrate lyase family protein [Anaerovoracaceae bacterium]|jgi:citrate lyase beta subunit
MKHNQYDFEYTFVKDPVPFTRDTERDQLRYCLGATLYMPATRAFSENFLSKRIPGLTSIVVCFEDSIAESMVAGAEKNALAQLQILRQELERGSADESDFPLLFFRPRSREQFRRFTAALSRDDYRLITGFVFPKFSAADGEGYLQHLEEVNEKEGLSLYGMPILEGREIAFKETRFEELSRLREIVFKYYDRILNIRVGGTDFSSCFGVRRGIDYSIYDIMTVRDCLLDILNIFNRDNEFVVSGPVWEYFLANKRMKFEQKTEMSLQSSLLKRKRLVNEAVDGLLREVILDRANGFIGKTAIHPTHIKYINAMMAVTAEEYDDAVQILHTEGGVVKSGDGNKMNEIRPHRSWAVTIAGRAKAYGVIRDESEFLTLVSELDT